MKIQNSRLVVAIILVVMPLLLFVGQPSLANTQQDYSANSCSLNRGLDIAILMDNSGSMTESDPEYFRVEAVKNMLGDLHDYDRLALIQFSDTAQLLQPLTSNRTDIENALQSIVPAGGTDMSLGLEKAMDELNASKSNNHKMIIVLTDGVSINNPASIEYAKQAYENNVTIFTIGLGSSIDLTTLTAIANETGGQYFQAANATHLTTIFQNIRLAAEDLRQPKVFSDWTLTKDLVVDGDLVLQENVKLNMNNYDVVVRGDLVLLSCAEMRAVSGTITANNVEQSAGSFLHLNNSQLHVLKNYKQEGRLRVNGDYGGSATPEIMIDELYTQRNRGYLQLEGYSALINGDFIQEGRVQHGGGTIRVKGDVTQRGFFDVERGQLFVEGVLTLEGGPLLDDAFATNKSLNVNGGVVQVGSEQLMAETSTVGHIIQNSGQLYINHGTVHVFGDYILKNGWLTMTKSSMDTTASDYGEGDGDYVHVYGDFITQTMRNHSERLYNYLGKPMNDQAHLTEGVLQIDGNFTQIGDKQYHTAYSDRSQNYLQDYSRYNFVASGRHKVLLTGKGTITVASSGFTFNILELEGTLVDYTRSGAVRWNRLIEREESANANLRKLAINGVDVYNFDPNVLQYNNHVVPVSSVQGPVYALTVDARADDYLNATVQIYGDYLQQDGTGQVRVVVTANDGKTQKVYTVNVTAGGASKDAVSAITLNKNQIVFLKKSGAGFSPINESIGYTITPSTASNQQVDWMSTNPTVATVSPSGIVTPLSVGRTTIIATTKDGGFTKTVLVEVKTDNDLLVGVKTLADFVADYDRYNQIMALYDPNDIGIVVPGQYIKSVTFNSVGNLVSGTVQTDATVSKVEVRVNNQQLLAQNIGGSQYLFSRAGLVTGDFVEIITYNASGDEIERIGTSYPVNFTQNSIVSPGFYSVQQLFTNTMLFNLILSEYAPSQLKFTLR